MQVEGSYNKPVRCSKCETDMPLEVFQAVEGYYFGRACKCGQYSIDSVYYATMTGAAIALIEHLEKRDDNS